MKADDEQQTPADVAGGTLMGVQTDTDKIQCQHPHLLFNYSLQFYLPDESVITKDFLKDVLAGKKDLLKKSEVITVEVTHYDELSVKALWPEFKKDAAMNCYFPDKYPVGKGPPREYFFNVLNTVHPNYLAQVMLHADKQRMTTEGEAMKKQSINISEYWNEQLKAMPYLSCK